MNTELLLESTALWHLAGWTMLHFLWLGTLVALAAGVCRLVVWRAGPNVRYATTLACLMLLATSPVLIAFWLVGTASPFDSPSFVAPSAPGPAEGMPTGRVQNHGDPIAGYSAAPSAAPFSATPTYLPTPVTSTTGPTTALPNPRQSRGLPDAVGGNASSDVTSVAMSGRTLAASAADALQFCVPYLPWVWLVGAPLTFALLATGIIGTRRLRRASRLIVDSPITELLARLAASLRVGRRVSIAVCERVAAPVLVGILRPLILLPPAALTGWSPDEIEMVLLHELAHVRRWDNAVNLAQRIVEAVLFFHPAVWLVSSWVRREREACCDAVVVGRTNRPHAYAELLVALAAQMKPSPFGRGQGEGTSRIAPAMFSPASRMAAGPLRTRIRHILQLEDDPMLVSGKSLVLVLAGLLVTATLAVLYLPAVGQAEESTASPDAPLEEPTAQADGNQAQTVENLKRLAIALQNSHDTSGKLPAHASYDPNGNPLLSWRVHILPFLGQGALYKEFHLQEPWDSEHNRKLIARMPDVFKNSKLNEPGKTNYLAVVGKECVFDGSPQGIGLVQIPDGTAKTISLVEADADQAVEWTKPQDWIFDRGHPTAGLGSLWGDHWYATFVSGHVLRVANSESSDAIGHHFTRAGGERSSLSESEGRSAGRAAAGGGEVDPASGAWAGRGNVAIAQGPDATTMRGFPSLADQKLADAVFRRLGWELEPIGAEDLARVKALGYDGGVRVAYAPQPGGFTNISYGHIQEGDILVGLHVWPTTNLAQVMEVLSRDDLHELNPIKFYIVRSKLPQEASGYGFGPSRLMVQGPQPPASTDFVMTGRITVQVDRKTPQPQIGTTPAPLPMTWLDQGPTPARPAPSTASPTGSTTFPPPPATPATSGLQDPTWPAGPTAVPTPEGLSILFFHSPDSAPSRTMRLLMKRIAEVPPQANFIEVDVTKSPELARQMNVDLVPTCFIIRDGKELARITGELPESQLRAQISAVMRSGNPRTANSPTTGATSPFVSRAERTVLPTVPAADPIAPTMRLTDQPAVAVVPEASPALAPQPSPAPTAADPDDKSTLRYDGKTFDEWRTAWRTELSTEKRLEAVKALAAFGGSGFGQEAAETVLEIAKQYDWRIVPGKSVNPLQDAIIDALFGGDQPSPAIPAQAWFPRVMEGVRAGDKPSQQLMQWILMNFHRLGSDGEFAIDPLLELTRSDDEALRLPASRALAGLDREHKNPRIVARLKEMLESNNPQQIVAALETVRVSSTALPWDTSHLLFHADEQVRRAARSAVHNLRSKQGQDLGQFLLEVLADPKRADDHVSAIRALGSLRQGATPAYATLEKLMLDREQPLTVRVAATKALERITGDPSSVNRLSVAFIEENKERQDTPEFRAEFHQLEQAIQAEEAAIP